MLHVEDMVCTNNMTMMYRGHREIAEKIISNILQRKYKNVNESMIWKLIIG